MVFESFAASESKLVASSQDKNVVLGHVIKFRSFNIRILTVTWSTNPKGGSRTDISERTVVEPYLSKIYKKCSKKSENNSKVETPKDLLEF